MILFILFPLFSFASEVSEICGKPQGWLPNLFNDLEKTRIKCVNDYYDKKKVENDAEIARLHELHKEMQKDLQKTAYKVEYNRVLCFNKDDPSYPKERMKRCLEIVRAQNAILQRVDILNGWIQKVESTPKSQISNQTLDAPCPTQQQLNELQAVRYFNKRAHEIWTKCALNNL